MFIEPMFIEPMFIAQKVQELCDISKEIVTGT